MLKAPVSLSVFLILYAYSDNTLKVCILQYSENTPKVFDRVRRLCQQSTNAYTKILAILEWFYLNERILVKNLNVWGKNPILFCHTHRENVNRHLGEFWTKTKKNLILDYLSRYSRIEWGKITISLSGCNFLLITQIACRISIKVCT